MIIVRNEHFIKVDGKLYIEGSSSNELYINNIEQMGRIQILGWITEKNNNKGLVPLMDDDRISVIEVPVDTTFLEKVKLIKDIVKHATCLSLKFCFIDSFIACHYANRYNIPYVIESGTSAFLSTWYHGGSLKYKLMAIPYELITRYYHRKAHNIIYVSKRYLQSQYPSKAFQIGCPDVVLPDVDEDVLNARLNKIDAMTTITLGLIGSTTVEFRGHDRLISVAALLRQKGYNVKVRFLGNKDGSKDRMKHAEKYGITDLLIFDGYKNKKGVYEWIDNIDVLVMPTIQETLGRAVIEAMSRSCPVIGSSETALPEQIASDCIASAYDINAIASIIEQMINDRNYMKLCAYENYYRAKKYSSKITNQVKKNFYNKFYQRYDIVSNI